MSKAFWKWVAWFLFLFVLEFTVPFLLLKDIPKMTGSFLFWLLWVIAAMGSMFFISSSVFRAAVGPMRSVQNVLLMNVLCAASMTARFPMVAAMA